MRASYLRFLRARGLRGGHRTGCTRGPVQRESGGVSLHGLARAVCERDLFHRSLPDRFAVSGGAGEWGRGGRTAWIPTGRGGMAAWCGRSKIKRDGNTSGTGTTTSRRGSSRKKIPSASPAASTSMATPMAIPSTSPIRLGCARIRRVCARDRACSWALLSTPLARGLSTPLLKPSSELRFRRLHLKRPRRAVPIGCIELRRVLRVCGASLAKRLKPKRQDGRTGSLSLVIARSSARLSTLVLERPWMKSVSTSESMSLPHGRTQLTTRSRFPSL